MSTDDTDWDTVAEQRAEEDAQRWADEHAPGVQIHDRDCVHGGEPHAGGCFEPATEAAQRLDATVPVRFPPELAAAAERLAEREGMTVSAWIRREVDREVARRSGRCPTCGAEHEPAGETGAQAGPPVAADLASRIADLENTIGQATMMAESMADGGQISPDCARRLLSALGDGAPRELTGDDCDRLYRMVTEGPGSSQALPAPDDARHEPASAHEKAQDRPGGKDGTEGESREAFVRRYRVMASGEDPGVVLIGWCAEAIGCLFHRAYDQIQGVTLGELIDAATEHEGEQGERAHAYLAEINGEDDHG